MNTLELENLKKYIDKKIVRECAKLLCDNCNDCFIPIPAPISTSALKCWTEKCGLDQSSGHQSYALFTPTTRNAAIIQPNNGGYISTEIPDDLNIGGAERGLYSTDWQRNRTDPSQVASGKFSFIASGNSNTASGEASFATGEGNIASGIASIAAGINTQAIGDASYARGIADNTSIIQANGLASNVIGQASNAGIIKADSLAVAGWATGFAEGGGVISTNSIASAALGTSIDATSAITIGANSTAAVAAGNVSGASSITIGDNSVGAFNVGMATDNSLLSIGNISHGASIRAKNEMGSKIRIGNNSIAANIRGIASNNSSIEIDDGAIAATIIANADPGSVIYIGTGSNASSIRTNAINSTVHIGQKALASSIVSSIDPMSFAEISDNTNASSILANVVNGSTVQIGGCNGSSGGSGCSGPSGTMMVAHVNDNSVAQIGGCTGVNGSMMVATVSNGSMAQIGSGCTGCSGCTGVSGTMMVAYANNGGMSLIGDGVQGSMLIGLVGSGETNAVNASGSLAVGQNVVVQSTAPYSLVTGINATATMYASRVHGISNSQGSSQTMNVSGIFVLNTEGSRLNFTLGDGISPISLPTFGTAYVTMNIIGNAGTFGKICFGVTASASILPPVIYTINNSNSTPSNGIISKGAVNSGNATNFNPIPISNFPFSLNYDFSSPGFSVYIDMIAPHPTDTSFSGSAAILFLPA